ncbi:metal ABC transporter permease [Tissierella creatinophila]|uniref:Manganese transport system membrane protein MntB n=1 Tax=Tissierella creatinophila DSM 6911 TaxID=1123403 RepID=A0A1U7M784_TISCR|nr:iron chelate uptake ABC transporter family permease subunit [Tissierella creatinophila]OLS03157.1 manganese transport system membrane protein MntB [Tissierella creatinophila DSM 6911]
MNIINLILTDYTLQIVSLGSALLGIISGVLGSFAVIRKESLLGDAVSHSALPGIALAFLLTGTKNTEVLLLGALLSGLLSTFLINGISKYSRIKFDSALALILSVFFGGGLVLLTYIQKVPNANQAGLEKFIFGQASTVLLRDVKIIAILGTILLLLVLAFWKEFKIVSFDIDFAESLGFDTKKITFLLFAMIVTSIIIGLQTVGVILMSAMLTAPAVAARQWTDKLHIMVILSALFGAISGIGGTIVSSVVSKLPTGPMIVIIISTIVIISLALAPNRGLVWRYLRNVKNQRSIGEDQVLANLYHLYVNHDNEGHCHDLITINPDANLQQKGKENIQKQLEDLKKKGFTRSNSLDKWCITDSGIEYVENYFKEGEE